MRKEKKFGLILMIFSCLLVFLAGCGSDEKVNERFNDDTIAGLKEKAKIFTNEQYQAGDVRLYEFVQITGKITTTDGKTDALKKGDRFILEVEDSRYQIMNQQDDPFTVGDTVTVYGEYYGLITAMYMEKASSGK